MPRATNAPISVRLALWYALTLGLLLGAFAAFCYGAYHAAIHRSFDRHLAHEWSALAPLVRVGPGGLDAGALEAAAPVATRLEGESGTYVRVLDPGGRIVYESPNTRGRPPRPVVLPAEPEPRAWSLAWAGGPARSRIAPLPARGGGTAGWIEVTGYEWTRHGELRELALLLGLGVGLGVLVALVAGWALARRALRPVAVLTDAAAHMAAGEAGGRLPTAFGVRDELTRLAETFNGLLARLQASAARERRFTADAAHELLTPLATLRTEAEVALRRERDGAAYREVLGRVVDEAEDMAATVQALLRLAQAEALARTDEGALDLSALVRERAERQQAAALARSVTVETTVEDGVRVAAQAAPLAEVVDNLLSNAVKYTPPGGRVNVRLTHAGPDGRCAGAARLEVADTGAGFDSETAARVFERFFRADTAEVQAEPGSGLGLSIVRAVVEGYGGEVRAASAGPGQGATFTVTLPCLGE